MRKLEHSVVVTAIRNEGPFLIEWLAWHRMLGFDNVLVLHNDCTDHSPQLLRLLERAGFLTQKSQQPKDGEPPKLEAYRIAAQHKLVRKASWALVCDVDEFLVVKTGDGGIADLADSIGPDHMGMAINWKVFGTDGQVQWSDELVHRRFRRCGPTQTVQNKCFKVFYREPNLFGTIRSHGPADWLGSGNWNQDIRTFVTSDGQHLETYTANNNPPNGTEYERISHGLAQLNHYALQSAEKYGLKRQHLSSAANLVRYTDEFFERFDQNSQEDNSVDTYKQEFDRAYAEIMAVPGVKRLHHLCCADMVARILALKNEDPVWDPRWQHHMETAGTSPSHRG
ncbi:glycosyltransferase family 2 protein [Aliiroseovarius marinus]|uniref:glycosyltransferase family 2 protein n=1 Tax=Aliiroseovarius marinus TaxID=2500159 RepID=UPI003D7D98D5